MSENAWTQPLDAGNVDDLTDTLMGTPEGWLGIVSEKGGGIIAYVHESNLGLLREALNDIPLS